MYVSISALVLLGLSLAWTALNKSGVSPFACYVSLILTGLAWLVFWFRSRRILSPPLPSWLVWTVRALLVYLIFQAIPLPLPLLSVLSPERAAMTRSLTPILGPVSWTPISVDPAAHILWLLTMAGCTAAFFLVRDVSFRLQNRLFIALLPLLAVATFEAVLGLFQIAAGAVQAVGSYNSRDHYCCILEMTLPLAIAFGFVFLREETAAPSLWPALKAVACWLMAALLVLGILFSLSRAGWIDSLLCLLVLASLLLLPRVGSTIWRIGIVGGFLLVAFTLFLFASPRAMLGRLVLTVGPDSEGRIYIWRELMPLIGQYRWFGTGLMGFDPVFLKYQAIINAKRIDFAHNDFLQYLIEMGLIGFVPLLISLAIIVWPVVKRSWLPSKPKVRILLAGCVASFSALLLHSLVDFNLYVPANLFAFAWILGFGSAVSAVCDTNSALH